MYEIGNGDPPRTTATVHTHDADTWKHTWDTINTYALDAATGIIGGDTETIAGDIGNFVGGLIVIGDVGAVVKNLSRMCGITAGEVNELEMALGFRRKGSGVNGTDLSV